MRIRRLLVISLAVVAFALAACGGGDEGDGDAATSPAPTGAPSGGDTTPPAPGALPPGLLDCLAEKGFEVESPADIHSAPPQVLQQCFQGLHQGGG